MKGKLISILGCLLLLTVLMSTIAHADYTLTKVHTKDTIRWSGLYDVETEQSIPSFSYEVPENGAAVLIFFRTTCGNCQSTFSQLNVKDWVHNDRVNFYAIEGSEYGFEDIRTFQQERCSNITDAFTWLDAIHAGIGFDYAEYAGLDAWTWPLVIICNEENGVKTVQYVESTVLDTNLIGNSLEELLEEDLGVPNPVPLTVQGVEDHDLAAEMITLTNQRRAEKGLPPLEYNQTLTDLAIIHAAEQVLYPNSYARPDGSSPGQMIWDAMPNAESCNYAASAYDQGPEGFLESIILDNFDNWYLFEYEEGPTDIGVGCVIVNNSRHWAIMLANDSTPNDTTPQVGQTTKTYTINCYPFYLESPGLSPAPVTVYLGETDLLTLYCDKEYKNGPLIPSACDSEIKDSNGNTIATAAVQDNGSILISATALGTGELNVWAWEGQKTPYTAKITVSDAPIYRLNSLHTSVEGSGRIELSEEQARHGTWIDLTAIADEGWWLAGLYIQDTEGNTPEWYAYGSNEFTFCMPASDVTVTAQFLPDSAPQTKFEIYEELWDNGTNSIHGRFNSAYANTTVTLQYTPESGYELLRVTVTDEAGQDLQVTKLGANNYSFQMPASNVTVQAIFAPAEGYPINIESPYGNGTATADPPMAKPFDTVIVTFTPDDGYEVDGIDGTLYENEYIWVDENTLTFTMPTSAVDIYAHFKKIPVTSGTFGEGLTWSFAEGTLTISGTGSLVENNSSEGIPWDEFREDIHTAIIEEGVTDIASFAFCDFTELTHMTIPTSVEYIASWAFDSNPKLTEITFAGSAPARGIESTAFWGVAANVYVPANDRSWTEYVTQDYCGTLTWNHSWRVAEISDPTCTEDGYTLYTCICGDSQRDDFIPALGHIYFDGICEVCGEQDPNHKAPIPNPFIDVGENDWFYAPVLWAVENNVTGGTSPNTFSPDQGCTRAQVVTFLWAANGKPEPKSMNNPFSDVSSDAWYCKAVMWAVEQSITGGISPTEFGPDQTCTRAQIVTFLYAAANKPSVNSGSSFIDVADSDWYAKPVIWAAENDVTGGIGDGMFGPLNTCTRAQVVTFLYKASLSQ